MEPQPAPHRGPFAPLAGAWRLLAAGFLIEFVVVGGGIDTVSVFLNALSEAEGWSRRALSLGISVGAVGAGLSTPLVGLLVDRSGIRVPMLGGVGLLAAGFGILATMTEPWHFVAANALLGPGFAACAMLPITVAVALGVPEGRALALGVVGAGASAGALVLAPFLQGLVATLGWRETYLTLGAAVLVTPLVCLAWALPRGRLAGASPLGGAPRRALAAELRRPGVGTLAALLVLPGLVTFGVHVHLVPLLVDAAHPATLGAAALGAAVGLSGVGKLGGGYVGDRLGALPTLRAALVLKALAVAALAWAAAPVAVGLFVVGHGIAVGAQAAVMPVIALAVLGSERFATLFGLLQLAATLAIGLAPLVPGLVVDATGTYDAAIGFWVAALGLAALVAARMRLPAPGEAGSGAPRPLPAADGREALGEAVAPGMTPVISTARERP